MVTLSEKFRFLRDDIFLCPKIDTVTGELQLVMQKIDLETNKVEFEESVNIFEIMHEITNK